MNRAIAHYSAADLTRAIIQQDTCNDPFLARHRAEQVDRTFRKLAEGLGYSVEKMEPANLEAAE